MQGVGGKIINPPRYGPDLFHPSPKKIYRRKKERKGRAQIYWADDGPTRIFNYNILILYYILKQNHFKEKIPFKKIFVFLVYFSINFA